MDADGAKTGYDIELTRAVSSAVRIPVIASGGAGNLAVSYTHLDVYKRQPMGWARLFPAALSVPVNASCWIPALT